MFIDINKIDPGGISFDTDLDVPDLGDRDKVSMPVLTARISGRAVPRRSGVAFSGRLQAEVNIPCSRCAEPFPFRIDAAVELKLVGEAVEFAGDDSRLDSEDASLYYAKEGKADLIDIAVEQIYLNLPQKAVCVRDCKGLCPECGANRNLGGCGCREETIDPRLAPLLELRKDT